MSAASPTCQVHLHGHLWRCARWSEPGARRLPVTADLTVAALLVGLGVDRNEVFGVVLNGARADPETQIPAGAEVEVLPAISGG